MFRWLEKYNNANPQIKYFLLNVLVYGLALFLTTVYTYARLDYVRSYKTSKSYTYQDDSSHR